LKRKRNQTKEVKKQLSATPQSIQQSSLPNQLSINKKQKK